MGREMMFSLPADGLPDEPVSVTKAAEAFAEAAFPPYPLGERNALWMAPLSKVLLRYF